MIQAIQQRPEQASAVLALVMALTQSNTHSRFPPNGTAPSPNESPSSALFRGGTVVSCQEIDKTQLSSYNKTSWWRQSMASWHLTKMPIPRRLGKRDPDLTLSSRIIQQRKQVELQMKKLQHEIWQARQMGNEDRVQKGFLEFCELAYGTGITPQIREDFLQNYGCTGWTEAVLDAIVDVAGDRGIVEVGAGNGQWARALSERAAVRIKTRRRGFDFVLAYDDMSRLPLNPKIYHPLTKTHHDNFFKVQPCTDVDQILRQWSCRRRVLLLVFPPSSNMAVEALRTYIQMDPGNDTLVYVGEGRGGVNADDEFFDLLENGEWVLMQTHQVLTQPGDKGYERLYVFQRVVPGEQP